MIHWLGKHAGRLALALVFLMGLSVPAQANRGPGSGYDRKLDKVLNGRTNKSGTSRVIVMLKPGGGGAASAEIKKLGGKLGRKLSLINGQVAELSNRELRKLANHPAVASIHYDRPTGGTMHRVGVTVGARAVEKEFGYDGGGVGVAVIDSGITTWHDDLTYAGSSPAVLTTNGQRVAAFVDFVNGASSAYDDHGHGTHVSGIIAGNGHDSRGARAGIAPAAHLVGLKVLDHRARGVISDVIAALDWTVQNGAAYNVRVANLSVGAAVTESFHTDPLTLACKRVVDAGIVVVTAAGNLGRGANGQAQYGGITAPGNAPWVITVGASTHNGTPTRVDDAMTLYSSRGPTAYDYQAKPDLVAPGTGVVSLSDPTSTLYTSKADFLVKGTVATSYKPYLSLTGTSMASPVVAGTVALMMQANPNLTPNLVKAILQYTAQKYNYDPLTQGAGFLNSLGAVQLADFFAKATPGATFSLPRVWSKQIVWGNHQLSGGLIRPNSNAWETGTVWGAALAADGENIVWGTLCDGACANMLWEAFDVLEENIVWGTVLDGDGENMVWGTFESCDVLSTLLSDCENIVWGTLALDENIVWGSQCGGDDCENMVWGSWFFNIDVLDAVENIVWGTSGVVATSVWTSGADGENLTWGSSSGEDTALFDDPDGILENYSEIPFELLFEDASTDTSSTTAPTPPAPDSSTTPITSDTLNVSGIQGGTL